MLAQRAGLLPAMTDEEALEAAAIASLSNRFTPALWRQRPLHRPITRPVQWHWWVEDRRPGPEISHAHGGALFLDELPEFARSALEALREPLETGHITIVRAAQRAEFPTLSADCGHESLSLWLLGLVCGPVGVHDQVSRYQARISGPLLDRIDLHVEVAALPPEELLAAAEGESSAAVQQRVSAARAKALQRQNVPNHLLQGAQLDEHLQLEPAALTFAHKAAARLGWSARGTHR